MKNQFTYKRKVEVEGKEPKAVIDSFNPEFVVRTLELEDGKLGILLNDFHEEVRQVPDINPKNGKFNGYKNVKENVHSEITLEADDAIRYRELTTI